MLNDPFGVGVAPSPLPLSGLVSSIRLGFVVAIPVKDEEDRLPACLGALAKQHDRSERPIPPALIRIVVFANNCTDHSASLVRSLGERWSLNIRVVEASLPPATAHAGNARRTAMDIAEAWLKESGECGGVILTTDADSQVAPNWIAEKPSRLAPRRSSVASILMAKASSYQRRFIGEASLRTLTSGCSRSCRGGLTPLSTIAGPTTPQYQARALG
jgi:hypothetical protein